MSKRQFVLDALDQKKVERVPVGFWYHFAFDELYVDSPAVLQKNLEGHQRFYDGFHPDFVKIMSDGYFTYPHPVISKIRSAADLKELKAIDPKDWIDRQVALVKEVARRFDDHAIALFYNVFCPATYLKWQLEQQGVGLGNLIREDADAVAEALNEIGKDVAKLAEAVITEGGADGIYFSFQNIQDAELSKDEYLKYIAPSELAVLDAANRAGDYNILHICGYEGAVNDLTVYVDYPAKAVNYAAVVEGVPLKQAKEIFGGRTILGGFGNTKNDLLYKGDEASIKAETKRLLDDAGTVGIILGADCTIPSDTPFAHLEWVREAAKEYAGIETGPRIRIQ